MAEGIAPKSDTSKNIAPVSPLIEFVIGQGDKSLRLRCEPQKPAVQMSALNVGRMAMVDAQQLGVDHQDWKNNPGDSCYIIKEGEDYKPLGIWGFKTDNKGAIVALSAHLQQDQKTLSLQLDNPNAIDHKAAVLVTRTDQALSFRELLPNSPYEVVRSTTANTAVVVLKVDDKYFLVNVDARKRAEQEIETGALRNYYAPESWEITSRVQQISEPKIV